MDGTPLRDLDDTEQISVLVVRFYRQVAQDDLLGPIFNEVAEVDWPTHIPKIATFWNRVLLNEEGYAGNPYRAHAEINHRSPFEQAHFDRWLDLFRDTIRSGWSGPRADQAIAFAERVAVVHGGRLIGQDPLDHLVEITSRSR